MRACNAVLLAALVLLGQAAAVQAQATRVERLGVDQATSTTSSVAINPAGIPSRTAGQDVLTLDGSGFVRRGTLGKADLPGTTVYTDQANTFGAFTQTFVGAAAFGSHAGTASYASQTTGWRIDASGNADVRYLFTDELHAKTFVADLEQALAGSQVIAKSVAMIAQAFTCPAAGGTSTLWVRDLPSAANVRAFASSDWVVIRQFSRTDGDSDGNQDLTISDCVGQVTAYADGTSSNEGQQSWTFTRGSGGNAGSMTSSTVVAVDSLVLDYGVSGAGYAEVNAIDGAEGINGPYYQVATWATSPVAANRTVRARMGNLRGITGTGEWGLLAGAYAATDGRFFRASDQNFDLHGIDLTIWDGSTQAFLLRRNSGAPYFSMGSPAPTAFGAGTGVWMGDDSGTYKFRVGNPSGNRLTWDGTTLVVAGDASGATNINGANIQTGTIAANKLSVTAGGANRTVNSSFEDSTDSKWTLYNIAPDTVTSSGRHCSGTYGPAVDGSCYWQTTWSGANTTTKGVYAFGAIKGGWRANTTYVISYYAWTNSSAQPMMLGWNTAPASVTAINNPNLTGGPQRYVYRVTWGSSVEASGGLFIGIAWGGGQTAGTVLIDALKIEEGDTLGGWAPAPEEILPGTVTADRLSVANLAAIHAETGTLSVTGALTVGTSGSVRSGKTTYGSGTGYYMDASGGTPRFDIGSASRYFRWTGTDVNIRTDELELSSSGLVTSRVTINHNGVQITDAASSFCINGPGGNKCLRASTGGLYVSGTFDATSDIFASGQMGASGGYRVGGSVGLGGTTGTNIPITCSSGLAGTIWVVGGLVISHTC